MLISNQHNQCKHDEGKCNVYDRETDSEDSQDGDKENIETDKNKTPLLENDIL